MKPKVLVTHRILPQALAYLEDGADIEIGTEGQFLEKEEIIEKIADKEGLLSLLTDTIDKDVLDAAPRLRIVANCAVGYNNIDVGLAASRGILVTNTPGVLTEATAELAWALILAVARRIPRADAFVREGRFRGWSIDLFLGKSLSGKTLGIIGMGRIGRAVARRGRGFGMEIAYSDPKRLPPEDEAACGAIYLPLDDLLCRSDIVSIHASLDAGSRNLISREKLRMMKTDAILVNVARGPIVDEAALAEALEKGRLWGAGLDVYEREPVIDERLMGLDNVVLLPHLGSATVETRLEMSMMAARNLVQGLRGEKPDNLIV